MRAGARVTAAGVSLDELHAEALRLLEGVAEGEPLGPASAALIALAVRAAPTVLDTDGIRLFSARALDAGASAQQVHDTLLLVAGIGFHTLAEGSPILAAALRERGDELPPLDLRGLEAFVAFLDVALHSDALPAPVRELICIAVDATPTHRYRPGLRLHLANAIDLGVGRAAVIETLAIAASQH